jgi:two-component system, OmpR family, sensor kinase
MIVDDRLDTVLRTVAAGPAAIRTQFRQLADLLGRTPEDAWTITHDEALDRLDSLHLALGDEASAALLRACAVQSPRLVAHFASRGAKPALAAIGRARLTEQQWLALIPTLPVQARGFLRHRHDLGPRVEQLLGQLGIEDFVLPEPDVSAAQPEMQTPVTAPVSAPREGIGAIVRRIEAYRLGRAAPGTSDEHQADDRAAPSDDQSARAAVPSSHAIAGETPHPGRALLAVDLRTDAAGTITGADAAHAAMLVGHRPFTGQPAAPASCDAETLRAVRSRLPVSAGRLALEGAPMIAGVWRIDAAPLFSPEGGQFQGYYARLRRPAPEDVANDGVDAAQSDGSADQMRQLLHELRTPINAIQGFAELIQQQLFGPTPHEYRSMAAAIASDAARMLAGFEDVERLTKFESSPRMVAKPAASEDEAGAGTSDLTALLARLVEQIAPVIGAREIALVCHLPKASVQVSLSPVTLERSIWRLFSVIAGAAVPGEQLALSLEQFGRTARLALQLPETLARRDDDALFAPDAAASAGGGAMLGSGFAMRLAAAEIRAGGGVFARSGAQLTIDLPLLTTPPRALSNERGS